MIVRIQCTEQVRFDQLVEMDEETWNQLKNTPARELIDEQGPLSGLIDQSNVDQSLGFDDVSIMHVDQQGNLIEEMELP